MTALLRSGEESTAAAIGIRDRYPEDKEEAKRAERAWAKELEQLCKHERERILLDIHGVGDNDDNAIYDADDEQLAARLEEMETELWLIKNKPAYERARQLDRSYVEDKAFRLMFLRASFCDTKAAAKMLALHFEVKEALFVRQPENERILVRDVSWEDLDDIDRLCVMSGFFQVGSKRDVAGRTIIFLIAGTLHYQKPADNVCRAMWYIMMSALRSDIEMQEKGIVFVVINIRGQVLPLAYLRRTTKTMTCTPVRRLAGHYCYQHASLHPAVAGFRLLLFTKQNTQQSTQNAFRFRIHFGDMKTIHFNLHTYGIPMDSCPVKPIHSASSTGVSVAWHLKWLETISELEKMNKDYETNGHFPCVGDSSVVQGRVCIIPRRFDVLLGRAKTAREHTGTLRCHHLIHMHRDVYEQASRRDKTKVADQVLSIIRESNGRFLRFEKTTEEGAGFWIPLDHEAAREKVSHMFRHWRAEEKKAQALSGSGSGSGSVSGDSMGSSTTGKRYRHEVG